MTVKVERGGMSAAVAESLPGADAGHVIRSLADEPDVTVIITGHRPAAGEIMIAISEGNCFLSLFFPEDEIYQYAPAGHEQLSARITFTIQGEVTGIESRYVVDVRTATAAVEGWLAVSHGAALPEGWVRT